MQLALSQCKNIQTNVPMLKYLHDKINDKVSNFCEYETWVATKHVLTSKESMKSEHRSQILNSWEI